MSQAEEAALDSASRAGAARDYWLPWTFRFVLGLPGPPLAIGAAAALLLLAADTVWFNATGLWDGFRFDGVPIWLSPYGSVNLTYAVSFGLSAVALITLVRGAERDLSRLGPALDLAPGPLAEVRRDVLGVSARSLRVGTAAALAIAVMDLWIAFTYSSLGRFDPASLAWLVIREVVCDLFFFRAIGWGVIVSLRLSRLARARVRVRLLDLATLRPFAQNGVRLALFWLLIWAIWVPTLVVGPMKGDAFTALAILLASGSALSALAIALPTRGVRSRLREAKAAELAALRGAIEIDRVAALEPDHPERSAAAARLPGLLAYETRVEGISEALFDAQALRRLALYTLIPLASWVGGALIEHVVDAVLD